MSAASSGTGLGCCCFFPFLSVWALIMGIYMRFFWIIAPSALDRWAQEEGYRILRREHRSFFRGPFSRLPGSSNLVFRIAVQTQSGLTKTGWVSVDVSGQIKLRWDEERPTRSAESPGETRGNPLMWDPEVDGPR